MIHGQSGRSRRGRDEAGSVGAGDWGQKGTFPPSGRGGGDADGREGAGRFEGRGAPLGRALPGAPIGETPGARAGGVIPAISPTSPGRGPWASIAPVGPPNRIRVPERRG